jgi:hypothetical protein
MTISESHASELDELVPLPSAAELKAAGEAAAEEAARYAAVDPAVAERFVAKILKSRHVALRRGIPIIGYIGDNGSGKTLTAVRDTYPTLRSGRDVVSTTPLFDPLDDPGTLHPLYTPLSSWRQIVGIRNADLLLDEVQSVANARMSNSIPPQLFTAFQQMRKAKTVVRWTTPHWSRVDVSIREITKAAVICRSSRPERGQRKGLNGWSNKTRFIIRTVDASKLDGAYTLDVGDPDQQVKELPTYSFERFKRPQGAPWLYDSEAVVLVLDHIDAGGWCMNCGGTRPRPKCSCPAH